jgi:lipopolysaccharide heptosyltransferase II
MPDPRWPAARRVLAVRLDSLGDVMMTTPALRALRDSASGRRVTLLTSTGASKLAPLLGCVDDVISYDAPWMKAQRADASVAGDLDMIETLRSGHFDAAVIFTVFSQNPLPAAMLAYYAAIPVRAAYCRENPYALLTDWIPDPEPSQGIRHEVERQLALVASLGSSTRDDRLQITLPAAAKRQALAALRRAGVDTRAPWLVLHAGSSAASRRYPPEFFAAAARRLALEHGFTVVLTGGSSERSMVDEIRRSVPGSVSLAGMLGLPVLSALIAEAPLIIVNNTGPAHLAAAVGTPVVCLYALTNPQHTPWRVESRVLSHAVPCANCFRSVCVEGHHDCLRRVHPDRVVEAALDLYPGARMPTLPATGAPGSTRRRSVRVVSAASFLH